jgi:PHD/YefM family antitoxin component YafN of YafNO toxin-antitoxin module
MQTLSASRARANIYSILADLSDPKLITSRRGNGVLMSQDDWSSIQETIYLMSNPKTRRDIEEGYDCPLSECLDDLNW